MLKFLGDFLGFTLVSIGGTLSAIGLLLLLARAGMGDSEPRHAAGWLLPFIESGVCGIIMLGSGVLLMRASGRD